MENDDLCIAGDGSAPDQLGSFAWCLASKNSDIPFFTAMGPVDGHRHHIKALQAKSTHVLASVALIFILEKFVHCSQISIPIFIDCFTLIKRVLTANTNSSSLVLADHIELIYQIRKILHMSKTKLEMQHSKMIKNDDFNFASWDEKLVQMMHIKTYGYFTIKMAILPRQYSDTLPGSEIMIVANDRPLVSDIGMTMQMMEHVVVRNEYFERRMEIEKIC